MEIENKIKNIMNDNFNSNHIQIDENTKLFSGGLNLTSINMLRLVLLLEKEFNIKINANYFSEEYFLDIKSLVKLINKLVNENI